MILRTSFIALTLSLMAICRSQGTGLAVPLPGTPLNTGQWKVYTVQPAHHQGRLSVNVTGLGGNADLYVRRGSAPTLTQWDHKSTGPTGTESVVVTNSSNPPLTSDIWYIGVYAKTKCRFNESHLASLVKAEFPGNGATRWSAGTTFRTFAPNAQAVKVPGQFNNWSTSLQNMASEGNGWWSVDYRNVTAGQQYKFYVTYNGQSFWKNDPWARRLTNSAGNSVVYDQATYQWQTQNFVTPPWNKMVVYETHIGAFNDTPGGGPGTFVTAEAKLDYLADLGINVIELLPVNEFPTDFSWGYNPSYPWSVESGYGGPDALKRFVDQANLRGIAVVLDVVHNHWGPNDLDLWRFDGWFQGNFGGLFFYNDARANTPWGPRPDFGRSEVRSYIRDSLLMFAQDYRMSGFRWDSVKYTNITDWGNNPDGWSLMQWVNDSIDGTQPWKISIAEDMQNNSWTTRTSTLGGAGFDSQWSNFVHDVRAALTSPDDNARDMNSIANWLNERFNGDAFERVIYTESHDEDANGKKRVPSEIDVNNPASYWAQKRSTLGAALVMTAPGIPMLFMGQEFLEDGWFDVSDPLDWSKTTTHAGIKLLYKDLIALRKNKNGVSAGLSGQGMNTFHVNNSGKVIAFHRYDQGGTGDDVVVVCNFKNTTYNNYRVGLPRSGGWSVAMNSDWIGYSSIFGNLFSPNLSTTGQAQDGFAQSGTVNLAPYTFIVLTKD